MGGRIYGPYTGRYFTSARQTDIEHMVATSEVHDSGLYAASAATRTCAPTQKRVSSTPRSVQVATPWALECPLHIDEVCSAGVERPCTRYAPAARLGRPLHRSVRSSQDGPGARGRAYLASGRRRVGREPERCARSARVGVSLAPC